MFITLLITSAVLFIIHYVFHTLAKKQNHWKIRKVPYLKPNLLFGNYREYILFKKCNLHVASEICRKLPNEPYIGTFYGTEPALLIQDPDLIKLVMTTDAMYFSGRENTDYAHREIITRSIFFNGGEEWKVIRQNLSPVFTIAKLKNMFPLITECVNELAEYLDAEVKLNYNIEVGSLLARYTMACIVSCAFGVNPNTMKKDVETRNPFVNIGNKIFDTSTINKLKIVCRSMWPYLFYGVGFKLFDDSLPIFLSNLFSESSQRRKNSKYTRNDFIDLFSELKNNKEFISESSHMSSNGEKKVVKLPVDELLPGMSFTIFAAGFETTSSTSAYLLYELAKNKVAQDLVIEEIDAYLHRHSYQVPYECVNELPYLEACIDETLRLYPVLGILTREVMQEYTLPTGLRLQKGDRIHVPVYHLHMHPDHFPEPEEFRPERFLGEERKLINPYIYMPFGTGARICMGKRLASMMMHAGLSTIFKKYRVELAENMPRSLNFLPVGLTVKPQEKIHLKFILRTDN